MTSPEASDSYRAPVRIPTFVLLTALQTAIFTPLFMLGVAWTTGQPLEATPAFLLRVALVGVGTAAVSAMITGWAASTIVDDRIGDVVTSIRALANGEPHRSLPETRGDALGRVSRAVNAAANALEIRLGDLTRDRARLEAVLSGMVEGVLVVNEQGQVQLANEAARQLLRLEASPIGRKYVELIRHPDIALQITQALQGERPGGLELSIGRDGQTFVARCSPAITPGSRGAVLVLHDITDLRRADRIRRDFVANVSHELRTPLTAIRGYVEALLDGPELSDQSTRFLEIIARHSWRMERLVKDLLRLARLDAGQERLDLADVSVEGLFSAVSGDLQTLTDGRNQTVSIAVAPSDLTLRCDPAKLHDVLRNLVENACAYTPEGSRIELTGSADAQHVRLVVADTGQGIPEAELPRIFERFYRVDKARSRESGGTGLGLSIVRHLVELHGGLVSATNRPEGGAVFTITLPRTPQS
ncbi:sensor histidine kinase [Luteitalea sp.]|uniref:sensor histidine kinase n=1 Tax=Luteitalea sp. TaxID=2004800 RepID=UPI0037C9959C